MAKLIIIGFWLLIFAFIFACVLLIFIIYNPAILPKHERLMMEMTAKNLSAERLKQSEKKLLKELDETQDEVLKMKEERDDAISELKYLQKQQQLIKSKQPKLKPIPENEPQSEFKHKEIIQIPIGPFKGKEAHYDAIDDIFIIDGNIKKAPKLEPYMKGQFEAPGVSSDLVRDYPQGFKKIHWIQEDENDPNRNAEVKECFDKGFGVMAASKDALFGKKKQPWIVMFHPGIEKAAREFMKIIRQDDFESNQYEIGALLGYRVSDVYDYVFGTKDARKAFPDRTFTEERISYHISKKLPLWQKIGLNRLKRVLGDEFKYVVAGDDPIELRE